MDKFAESVVEDAALGWLESLGYAVLNNPSIATAGAAICWHVAKR